MKVLMRQRHYLKVGSSYSCHRFSAKIGFFSNNCPHLPKVLGFLHHKKSEKSGNHSSSVRNKWITCTHVFFILGKIRHSFKVVIHEFEEQKKLEKIFYLHEKVKLAIKKKRQNKQQVKTQPPGQGIIVSDRNDPKTFLC